MQDSTMSAMFGAMSNEIRMNQIANNLANVNTNAYKKERVAFHDTFVRFAHDYVVDSKGYLNDKEMWPKASIIGKPRLSEQRTDFSQGHMKDTGNQLDFALQGEGFFKVRTPDGDFLTRDGAFSLTNDGRLITPRGFEVLGEGGPITIPPGAQVEVNSSGQIMADGQSLGSFQLTDVDQKEFLKKSGNNLFQIDPESNAREIAPTDLSVEQGYVEAGNVEVVTEMVAMIETQRSFEMYTKIMQGTAELDQKVTAQVGSVTG
ncbi:MAG: flagellar basal-body rod protein FlgF [Proteobacteria bacterium]|nr:flagellar basal-body rod protein FlgF [Pseudomonadota bacterium]